MQDYRHGQLDLARSYAQVIRNDIDALDRACMRDAMTMMEHDHDPVLFMAQHRNAAKTPPHKASPFLTSTSLLRKPRADVTRKDASPAMRQLAPVVMA